MLACRRDVSTSVITGIIGGFAAPAESCIRGSR